jgi:hypothetical protein
MRTTLQLGEHLSVAKSPQAWSLDLVQATHPIDVLPDGRLMAIQKGEGEDEVRQLEVTLNLLDELKSKAREASR